MSRLGMPDAIRPDVGAVANLHNERDENISSARVPHSIFDTGALPRREAIERWHEHLEPLCEPRFARGTDAHFHARVDSVVLDKIVIGGIQATAQTFDRSRFRVARHGVEHYVLHFFKKGRMECRSTETGRTLEPGDMLVTDMSQPHNLALTDIDFLHVAVPRPLLAPLLADPEGCSPRHIRGNNVLVKLLHDQTYALFSHAASITTGQARALLPSVLELSAAAINGAVEEHTIRGVESSLVQAIRRHVDLRALDRDLSPGSIATQFGISPRKLSYLFQADGGIATYIQSVRLRLVRRALMDPAQRGRTIGEIAQAHGFSHRTSFIRAFERAYHLTPGQQRALAAGRRKADAAASVEHTPFRWIDSL